MSYGSKLRSAAFSLPHTAPYSKSPSFFEEGQDIDDLKTLVTIGTAAGLDGEAVRAAREQGIYREYVIQDEREAAELGVTAVPTIMVCHADRPLEKAEVLSGAQPYEAVKAAVERAKALE